MKVYVAAASREIDRAKKWIARLREVGVEATFDWTQDVEQWGSAGADLSIDLRAACAQRDLDGIEKADLFWLLAPSEPTIGAWIEFGYVLGLYTVEIVVSPPLFDTTPFGCLEFRSFTTDEEAFAWIRPPN